MKRWPLVFLLFAATSLVAQTPEALTGLATVALEAAVPAEKLEMLRAAGFEPERDAAYEIAGPDEVTVAAFREPDGTRLLLYHFTATDVDVFARIGTGEDRQPEVRIWSDGPSEIVMSPAGVQLVQPEPSNRFRFRAGATALSVPDTSACIARSLGVALTRTALEDHLAQSVCTATSSIALVLTVTNCLSTASIGFANVFATFGCVNGIAKLISCGMAECSKTARVIRGY